ncbi:hypothetical protein BDB00DRAFT_785622 [Zychaea mexicana]|uniref:uncharacterized protein n=1 Tax=Zychaea mexicana TaxID=64656 RepID=UPI0022FECBC8|nr:uncharacterized protein BDB00DRAFT_785622 [Zychaea mexicana]KAI9496551.1 hypothetical protein BDB00DRAFT_785622 [Zychaea mexicana]
MKFTPSIDPKRPKLFDTNAKVHVKFDGDSNVAVSVPTTVIQVATKKRSSDQAEIDSKDNSNKDDSNKKRKAGKSSSFPSSKKAKNGSTAIQIPGQDAKKTQNGKTKKDAKAKYRGSEKKKLTEEEVKEKVRKIREKKRQRQLAKKVVDGVKVDVPTLRLKPDSVKQKISLSSIRDLILYSVTQANPPSWATITHRASIKHTVVIFVHGLDIISFGAPTHRNNVPHSIDTSALDTASSTGRAAMPFFTSCFSHMFVSKLTGGSGKVFSPVSELLQCPVGNNEHERQKKASNERLKKYEDNLNEYYILTLDDMKASGYPIPTFLDPQAAIDDDWKETRAVKEPIPKKKLIAIDCEMVETAEGKALARVTLVNEDGNTLLDEYVKPSEPILDYLTQYSGITPEIMKKTTCSLRRAQKHVRKYVDHNVILIGHGLENDLHALKLSHPYCADTSILYDSFKGKPFKPALRHLSRNLLKRVIQHQSKVGHDSAEDARAALDLFKLKVKRGPDFGRFGNGSELISDRLHKHTPPKSSALLEASETPNGVFASSTSLNYKHYDSEDNLIESTIKAASTHDFVFSQFDTLRPKNKKKQGPADMPEAAPTVISTEIASGNYDEAARMTRFDSYFQQMYKGFPSGTLVLVLGGLGNEPRYHE